MSTQETNLKEYVLEKSANNGSYTAIATIKAQGLERYSYADISNFVQGANYQYRLKAIDIDGTFSYSDIAAVAIPKKESLQVYPNPANSTITINMVAHTSTSVSLINPLGKTVFQKVMPVNNGTVVMPVNNIANGTYYLKVMAGNNLETTTIRIVHQ